jgi:hypothetical protein
MTKSNMIKGFVLSALVLTGTVFPAVVALSNRPVGPAAPAATDSPRNPVGDVILGAVTMTEELPGTVAVVKATPRHAKRTTASAAHDCRRVTLEQQGRPDARQVWACEGSI